LCLIHVSLVLFYKSNVFNLLISKIVVLSLLNKLFSAKHALLICSLYYILFILLVLFILNVFAVFGLLSNLFINFLG
jgi:hypothetical protein